jgi:AraC family transcriptional regulator, regulatory protein of adaptative response / methylated-DNA-[protein]-cysteine methyltransferase
MNATAIAPLPTLPSRDEMLAAMRARDSRYEGVFFIGVKTTGIFCRPGCAARRPRPENVEFFADASGALHAGYRPCLRCKPLDRGEAPPPWVKALLARIEAEPERRLRAADLRALGVHPARAARWFKAHYGLTFQGWHRARRVGRALRVVRAGGGVGRAADRGGYQSESGLRDAFVRLFGAPPTRVKGQPVLTAKWMTTPLGPMLAVASDEGLCLLEFVERRALEAQIATLRRRVPGVVLPGEHKHLRSLETELREYFAGERADFTVPLHAPGTDFQRAAWEELRRIPAGETRSYAQMARALGRPSAVRAVARANGDNRIALLLPCHRVIGSDGKPVGYAGGIWRKEWLLAHERGIAAARG